MILHPARPGDSGYGMDFDPRDHDMTKERMLCPRGEDHKVLYTDEGDCFCDSCDDFVRPVWRQIVRQ